MKITKKKQKKTDLLPEIQNEKQDKMQNSDYYFKMDEINLFNLLSLHIAIKRKKL